MWIAFPAHTHWGAIWPLWSVYGAMCLHAVSLHIEECEFISPKKSGENIIIYYKLAKQSKDKHGEWEEEKSVDLAKHMNWQRDRQTEGETDEDRVHLWWKLERSGNPSAVISCSTWRNAPLLRTAAFSYSHLGAFSRNLKYKEKDAWKHLSVFMLTLTS